MLVWPSYEDITEPPPTVVCDLTCIHSGNENRRYRMLWNVMNGIPAQWLVDQRMHRCCSARISPVSHALCHRETSLEKWTILCNHVSISLYHILVIAVWRITISLGEYREIWAYLWVEARPHDNLERMSEEKTVERQCLSSSDLRWHHTSFIDHNMHLTWKHRSKWIEQGVCTRMCSPLSLDGEIEDRIQWSRRFGLLSWALPGQIGQGW